MAKKYIIDREKDNFLLQELQKIVFDGADPGLIDHFFKKYEIDTNTIFEERLVDLIINATYFFSFRSLSFDREVLDEESNRRQINILKKFSLCNQLILLNLVEDDINEKHFAVLNYYNVRDVVESTVVSKKITYLFNKERFSTIEKIEKILSVPLLQEKNKMLSFYYKEGNSSGGFFIDIKKSIFMPMHDIIFAYTKSKGDYLNSRNIALPTSEEVNKLKDVFLKELENNIYFKNRGDNVNVQNSFNFYLYHHLEKKIEKKELIEIKKPKI